MPAGDLDNERFPRSSRYERDWILERAFGSHPLWMLEWLCEVLELRPGQRVLDLGCGLAKSSIFLAREFDVEVWATDLWIEPGANRVRVEQAGLEGQVFPVFADARNLPFAGEFFDAIVSVDAFQYFGTDDLYLNYLLRFLVPDGRLGIASTGLMAELEGAVPEHLRDFWSPDCWCLHSAAWWERHWSRAGQVEVERADTMPEGWREWVKWCRVNHFDEWTATLEADAGRNLGYVRAVARRIPGAELWDPPGVRGPGPT